MASGPARERLGVFGGTFDPPHAGHIELAEAARTQFGLHRVLFVVAGDPWQKEGAVVGSARDRLAMVEAAVRGREGLAASAMEVERPGPSYTADTLEALARPDRALFLILGADVAAGLDSWHRSDRVRELATLLVADRPGAVMPAAQVAKSLQASGWRCDLVGLATPHDVSSTELRERLARGDAVADVPREVVRVIEEHGLYTRR